LFDLPFHRLRHRGPDWSGCTIAGNHILCHERLAIVGVGESLVLILSGNFVAGDFQSISLPSLHKPYWSQI
jgi:hypothetical protein